MPIPTTPTSTRNLDGYGAPVIDWSRVRARLDEGFTQAPETGGPDRHTTWLATVGPDGQPHARPLGAIQIDGAFYFSSGEGTLHVRNIARNPRVSLSVATHPFDIVIEGTARKVTDEASVQRAAEAFAAEGWAPTVRDGAFYHEFSAPSAGPPPWYVYEITPETVYALGTAEPYGATRYDF